MKAPGRALILVPVLLLGMAGCGTYVGRTCALTLATDKDVPIDRSRLVLAKRGVMGESAETVVLVFIGARKPLQMYDEAMRSALEQSGGDVLLDFMISEARSGFFPVYWNHRITVRGDAYRLERGP